ncbi:DUF6732 family protein [Roseibium sp.]|uniref:DUF6732 family protein n=1 Tax=Roseibium sp. TaxID=1936156 RepID=UPI003D13E630
MIGRDHDPQDNPVCRVRVFGASAAFAHAGHLGELAGHAHWAGVAALAGAALIAGVAAWAGRKDKDSTADSEEADVEPGETVENPAS